MGSLNPSKGDLIEIKSKDLILNGLLINDEDEFFIIKLKSGYDVVIRKKEVESIKIIEKSEKISHKDIKPKVSKADEKFDIRIIATGGTIDSKVDYNTGGVSPGLSVEDYIDLAPEMKNYGKISIEKLMSILSENIQVKDWISIAKEIYSSIKLGAKGIVVTMGTDTMHYTASMISFLLNPLSVPVVFTGAQRSSDRGSSDAHMNLLTSVISASKFNAGESMICMHATINDTYNFLLRGNKARKMHTERRDAFRPINIQPLAKVYLDGNIEKIIDPIPRANETKIDTKIDENVKILLTYPGFNGDIIDYYIQKGVHGLVIAGTGFGNIPIGVKNVYTAIERASERNIPIVITSQTIYGRTNKFVYSTLRQMSKFQNIIYVGDMITETAYTKLMFALGHWKDTSKIKEFMEKPVAGEISERSELDTFLI